MALRLTRRPPYSSIRTPFRVPILTIPLVKSGTLRSDTHGSVDCLRSATRIDLAQFESSTRVERREAKGDSMRKAKGEMRRSYKRADFARLERGKFYAEAAKGTAVALLEPAVAKAFPTSRAVNDALSGLLALTEKTSRVTRRPARTRAKAARAG
jgi:hypothetical protein